MVTTISSARVWRLWKESKSVSAFAVFEDSTTRVRIEEFCRELGRELEMRSDVAPEMWPISELRAPQLRGIACNEAARADLIIVSVHYGEALPEEMKLWLDGFQKHKPRRHAVLLALFDGVHNGPSAALQSCLKNIAEKSGMEFLAQTDDSQED